MQNLVNYIFITSLKGAAIAEPLLDDIFDLQLFKENEMRVQIQGNEIVYQTIFKYTT